MISRKDRIAGGLIGLLVGDALGVPYEFHGPEQIPAEDLIEFTPPPGFRRAHRGVPPGTWSDDGALALCLLASLLECDAFDPADFGHRIVRWREEDYMAVDNVFDIGGTTSEAIDSLIDGVEPLDAGPAGDLACGNGALMRALPLALWHSGSDEELVRDAQLQSRLTHGHLRSQVCCALYCLWARRILEESQDPWSNAVATLRQIYNSDPEAASELELNVRPDASLAVTGSGYVVDCLHSAHWAVEQSSYEQIVRAAIRLGNDTDTTACVAGGIAGLLFGASAIPERWLGALRGMTVVQPLLDRLQSQSVTF